MRAVMMGCVLSGVGCVPHLKPKVVSALGPRGSRGGGAPSAPAPDGYPARRRAREPGGVQGIGSHRRGWIGEDVSTINAMLFPGESSSEVRPRTSHDSLNTDSNLQMKRKPASSPPTSLIETTVLPIHDHGYGLRRSASRFRKVCRAGSEAPPRR